MVRSVAVALTCPLALLAGCGNARTTVPDMSGAEYAPPDAFPTVDHQVFSPLKHPLRLFPAGSA